MRDITNSDQLYGGENKNRDDGKKDARKDNLSTLQEDHASKANIRRLVELQNVYTAYQSIANAWEHGRKRQAHQMAPDVAEARFFNTFSAFSAESNLFKLRVSPLSRLDMRRL